MKPIITVSEQRTKKYVQFEQELRLEEKKEKIKMDLKELRLKTDKERLLNAINQDCFEMANIILKRILKLTK